jgi:hypothetical protein
MVKGITLFLLLILCSTVVQSQDLRQLGNDTQWYSGFLTLNDGQKLEGLIKNNDKEGIISFKENANDSTTHSVRPYNIVAMEYFDAEKDMRRRFASLATKDKSGPNETYLFEIIREFESFAVIALQSNLKVLQSRNGPSSNSAYYAGQSQASVISQFEAFFFVNDEGLTETYLVTEFRDVDGWFDYTKSKGRIVDASLFSEYIGEENWKKIKSYVKENDVKLNTRVGLIKALDYYSSLLTK